MKKATAIICAALLAGVMIMMTACGGSAKYADSKYLGKWTATKAMYSGIEMGVKDILGGEFSFTLTEDGKVTMKVVDQEKSGKWEEIEGGIQFDGDDDMTLKDDGEALTMDYSGVKLTFEKE
ncbi:MAG: hypothetical protein II787_00490 [Lachnospiraceae bacterium]|jgi:hypothetical protein|nr:hypothetical protein [Lachnospiraceae bacterium]